MSSPRIRVLLVEDDEDDALLIGTLLRENAHADFEVSWVGGYDAALEELGNPYDVCLVDSRLGEQSGLALIAQATAKGFCGPMILMAGEGDHPCKRR